MTTIHVECGECGKAYDVPDSKAGKRFKCTGCGNFVAVAVAAALSEAEPETAPVHEKTRSAAALAPRPSSRPRIGERTAEKARAAKKGDAKPKRMPLILGGAAFAAILGVGGFFLIPKKGTASGGSAEGALANVKTQAKDPTVKGGDVKVPEAVKPQPEAPKDPVAEKKKELDAKLAGAEKAANPAEAMLGLVTFCQADPKIDDAVKGIYERVLSKDSENATAREGLGYKKYEGSDPAHAGQWLTSDRYAEVTEADAKKKAAEEKRNNDPFVKAANRIVKDMQGMIDATNALAKQAGMAAPETPVKESDLLDPDKPRRADAEEAKFKFFFDCKEVPRPYLIAVQDVGVPRPESWASDIGEILSALHRTFYKRYSSRANLRDLTGTPVPVWLFASKGSYDRWRRSGNGGPSSKFARAFYSGTQQKNESGFLYLWLRDPREEKDFIDDPIEDMRETTWHEGTHQLMDFNATGRAFSIGNSPWMQEGFAEYVGGYRRLPDKSEPDGWNYFFGVPQIERNSSIVNKGLQEVVDPDEKVEMKPSLREIVHCDYPQFWAARQMQESKDGGAEVQKARELVDGTYALGWGLCHFLQHAENGKYRDRFHDWLKAELEKRSSGEYFDTLFGLDTDEKWDAFELEFQKYVIKTLRRDSKDAKNKEDRVLQKYQKDFLAAVKANDAKKTEEKKKDSEPAK